MRAAATVLAAISVFCFLACGLSAAQEAAVARTGVTIAACETVGRECKADGGTRCYGEYRACMSEGGI